MIALCRHVDVPTWCPSQYISNICCIRLFGHLCYLTQLRELQFETHLSLINRTPHRCFIGPMFSMRQSVAISCICVNIDLVHKIADRPLYVAAVANSDVNRATGVNGVVVNGVRAFVRVYMAIDNDIDAVPETR